MPNSVERGGELRFLEEAGAALLVGDACGRQNLEGDRAVQAGIARLVDLTQPPAPMKPRIS